MGLKQDIYDALAPPKEEITPEQREIIEKKANDLTNAIVNFLTKQTFTITQLKAVLEVEEIKTIAPLTADILPSVQSTGIGNAGVPVLSTVTLGTKGVLIPSLNLNKYGGQGGMLQSKGHAYIGRNPIPNSKTNEDNTQVKLLEDNIVGK